MGRIGQLLEFVRTSFRGAKVSDVKLNPGGGENKTAQHFADPGDDSYPLPCDFTASMAVRGTGVEAVVGYVDPNSSQVSNPGDKRIYARDETGAEVANVWLKNDGSILSSNSAASVEIKPDGTIINTNGAATTTLAPDGTVTHTSGGATMVLAPLGSVSITNAGGGSIQLLPSGVADINGATIAPGGVMAVSSLMVGAVDFGTHFHTQPNDSAGNTEQPTNGPQS